MSNIAVRLWKKCRSRGRDMQNPNLLVFGKPADHVCMIEVSGGDRFAQENFAITLPKGSALTLVKAILQAQFPNLMLVDNTGKAP